MKKVFLCLGIIIMLFMICTLTGCSNNDEKVVIYTSMEEERNQELKKQVEEKFPDIEVVVQYMATGNSSAKLKTEGTNIEADIILDLETAYMTSLKENFADLSQFDSSIYVDGVVKANNYFPWVKYTMALIIDKTYFEEHNLEIPKTYEDLLEPEYKDLIAMPDPKLLEQDMHFS